MTPTWSEHLAVLHRLTGHQEFWFSHGVRAYVFKREGAWFAIYYHRDKIQHARRLHGSPRRPAAAPHGELAMTDWAEHIRVQHRLTGHHWFLFSVKGAVLVRVHYHPKARTRTHYAWFWVSPEGAVGERVEHSAKTLNICLARCEGLVLERVF